MIYIDIPQVAYRTWGFEYVALKDDGERDRELEAELERDLEKILKTKGC